MGQCIIESINHARYVSKQKPTAKNILANLQKPGTEQWNMEKLMVVLFQLIKKNLLLFTDDAYKLKESTIIDETEAEIETVKSIGLQK